MPTIEIDDIAAIGAVQDTPAYQIPPEAWTIALNMRAKDGGMERAGTWEQIFGTPGTTPHFLMSVATAAVNLWLYTSLTKAYGYDGSTHTNITRQTAGVDVNYAAPTTESWNGTMLGGVPIINNGTDVPQFWSPAALVTKLQNLTNWPAGLRARVIRAFGPFLVAFNLTDTGTALPHTAQWSHPADPGSIPSSWDYTNPAVDAGRRDFPDTTSGVLLDAMPLGATMFVYKETSVWRMRYIGGRSIFDFGESAWLPDIGLLAPRCVTLSSDGRQVWVTQDDIMWHNGNTHESILNKRQRRRLFNEIDTTAFRTSFMFDNPTFKELWFCYPSSGQLQPDRALILNYGEKGRDFVITEADGITFRNAATGNVEQASDETWASAVGSWDADTAQWSELLRRRTILAGTDGVEFYNLDKGSTRDGNAFTGTLAREGFSVVGRKRNGDWIVDIEAIKLLKGMWPKAQGGPIDIRFGSQETISGATTWGAAEAFDPTARSNTFPHPVSGRLVGFEMSAPTHWRLDGYKADIDVLGKF